MLKRKYAILAGAIATSLPVVSHAAMVTIGFDLADFSFATSGAGPYTTAANTPGVTVTGTSAAPVVTMPVGEYMNYGLQGTVTGVTAGINALGATGLASYQTGIIDANAAVATINPSPTIVSPFFSSIHAAGTADPTGGGVGAGSMAPAGTAGSFIAGNGTISSPANYGANTPADLYTNQRVKPTSATATGTDTFTVTQNIGALGFLVQIGTTSSQAPTYSNRAYTSATDTVAALPVLTVNYGTPGPSGHSIISLTAGTTAPSGYGSADGTLTVTGKGNGSYNVSTATGFTSATTGFVAVSGFNPTTDTEIYALKLNNSGGAIPTSSTQLAAIIADINGSNGNSTSTGVVASAVSGVYSTLFPGYDILLTSSGFTAGAGGTAELGFDFSSGGGEQNAADAGVYVAGVAAVPEPATAAGIVLGASGLLLGRRRKLASVV